MSIGIFCFVEFFFILLYVLCIYRYHWFFIEKWYFMSSRLYNDFCHSFSPSIIWVASSPCFWWNDEKKNCHVWCRPVFLHTWSAMPYFIVFPIFKSVQCSSDVTFRGFTFVICITISRHWICRILEMFSSMLNISRQRFLCMVLLFLRISLMLYELCIFWIISDQPLT